MAERPKGSKLTFDPKFDLDELLQLMRFFGDPMDSRIIYIVATNLHFHTEDILRKLKEEWYDNIAVISSRVSEILLQLKAEGYIMYTSAGWEITPKGNHSLIKLDQFINRVQEDREKAKPKPKKKS